MATAQASASASSPARKSVIGIIFLTMFLDLMGFSMIFPLFPAMLKYYMPAAQSEGWLADVVRWLHGIGTGSSALSVEVLFGGLLGSVYSALQFFCSPFWGHLSDRIGRRTVLLITVAGTGLSYLLWIFSGKFWMLVLARGLGGIMSGNVSVCTAAVADSTTAEKRTSGMAIVMGGAFGLGFILGPALGGGFSLIDLTTKFTGAEAFGINPFSACAMAAFTLSVINYFWVLARFPETLPPEKRSAAILSEESERPTGLKRLAVIFRADKIEIRRANLVNLFYTLAFSGMEFTLTFLAAERFNYTPSEMTKIFIFMGVMLLVVRGWIGRKYVHKWGEKRTASVGLVCGMAGFLLIGFAGNVTMFYVGMGVFSLSVGLITVCLPALVSLYSSTTAQGKNLGAYNSAGALARAVGPIFCSLIYFWAGAKMAYAAGAVALIIPLWLAMELPAPPKGVAAPVVAGETG